jgi:hypothetical protein
VKEPERSRIDSIISRFLSGRSGMLSTQSRIMRAIRSPTRRRTIALTRV